MFDSLFDVPLAVMGPAIIGTLCLFGLAGLLFVRRRVLPRLRIHVEDSEFSGTMVQSVMVFYGLAMALIAVTVFQTYSDVSRIVSQEATALAALYRDVSGYPEPIRPVLQEELRGYTEYVISEAWPQQQRGEISRRGVEWMNRFQSSLISFEPATDGERIEHAETLRAFNGVLVARSLRLDAVQTRLPTVMWIVIVAGALISLSSSFFFKVEDVRLQAILVSLLSGFMGLVIFMILALDRPFRGDLGVTSEPYRLVYDLLMKR